MQNPAQKAGGEFLSAHSALCTLHSALLRAGPALAACAWHTAVLAAYLAAFHGDPSALACVARERLGQAPYEHAHTGFDRNGYDGQFYYAIARAPWARHDLGVDAPSVRQARILYPALSWLFSAGDARRLFQVMPLMNLLGIAALAALGAAWAGRNGLSPWWGVLLPFAVNAGMPALRNLTDVWSTLAVAALLVVWLMHGPSWVLALAAAAALFGREQNVIVVLLVLAFALRRSPERDGRRIAGLLAALLLWSGWLCLLRFYYGEWSLLPAGGNLGPPLAGMIYRWSHLTGDSRGFAIFHAVCMATLTLQLGLALWLWRQPRERLIHLVALAGAGLAVVGGVALYGDTWSYPRVFAWLPLGVWLGCVEARRRWPLIALSAPCLLPLAVLVRVWGGAT
jgi:hypothetical protein